ncbi:hypothetical protein BaRGS_00029921 [Batillaria attramentaria]|uniref:Uncharacterized protein n=1 Tax=Batillaria attramentaria TaxID=370345 RepID=A0ABD0JUS4_9CAEN
MTSKPDCRNGAKQRCGCRHGSRVKSVLSRQLTAQPMSISNPRPTPCPQGMVINFPLSFAERKGQPSGEQGRTGRDGELGGGDLPGGGGGRRRDPESQRRVSFLAAE